MYLEIESKLRYPAFYKKFALILTKSIA